jgi:uncharacterized membrane protein
MTLSRVQSLRKVSILTVIAAVALLAFGSRLPKMRVAVLDVAFLSFPFVLWDDIWPRQARKQALEDMIAVQSPEPTLKLKLARGEITQEQFERMIVQLQERPLR